MLPLSFFCFYKIYNRFCSTILTRKGREINMLTNIGNNISKVMQISKELINPKMEMEWGHNRYV